MGTHSNTKTSQMVSLAGLQILEPKGKRKHMVLISTSECDSTVTQEKVGQSRTKRANVFLNLLTLGAATAMQ